MHRDNKHMEKHLASLVTRDLQIEITTRQYISHRNGLNYTYMYIFILFTIAVLTHIKY